MIFQKRYALIVNRQRREIEDILVNLIESRNETFFFDTDHLPFRGYFRGDNFYLRRIIHYQNAFLPSVYGEINLDLEKIRLDLKIALSLPQIIFTVFWYLFLSILLIFTIAALAEIALFALPLLVCGFLAPAIAFDYESKKIESILNKAFQNPNN